MRHTVARAKDADALEGMIDRLDLDGVLLLAAEIARAKAEHIRGNWQDYGLARQWDTAAKALDRCLASAAIRAVSR